MPTYVFDKPNDIGHLDDVSYLPEPDDGDIGKTTRHAARERTEDQMETASTNRNTSKITLIDATELDDEQFNDLISSIDPRRSLFPVLCGLVFLLALAMIS